MYVCVKEQIRIVGTHIEEQIEERREHSYAEVDDSEEGHHLESAPERLDQFAAEAHGDDVRAYFPKVYLQEAKGEGRPEPEDRWQKVTWCHAQDAHRLLGKG